MIRVPSAESTKAELGALNNLDPQEEIIVDSRFNLSKLWHLPFVAGFMALIAFGGKLSLWAIFASGLLIPLVWLMTILTICHLIDRNRLKYLATTKWAREHGVIYDSNTGLLTKPSK